MIADEDDAENDRSDHQPPQASRRGVGFLSGLWYRCGRMGRGSGFWRSGCRLRWRRRRSRRRRLRWSGGCLSTTEIRQPFLCGTQAAFSSLAQVIMLLIFSAPIGLTLGIKLVHVLLQVSNPLGGGGAQFHPLGNVAGVIVEGSVKVLHQLRRHHFV